MPSRCLFVAFVVLSALMLGGCATEATKERARPWPQRVLVVNDDGLDSPGLQALVAAFAAEESIETFVAAPRENQSGTSAHARLFQDRALEVRSRDLGPNITAWEVDGYPADCVLFALWGPMRENPPDLILSGLNSGSNLGWSWAVSGTVGAARIGALMGVPALSLSGFDDNDPEAIERVPAWCVELARSEPVRRLKPRQFLAVSFPRVPMDEIRGVRVKSHAAMDLLLELSPEHQSGAGERWVVSRREQLDVPVYSDAGQVRQGYIVVVPCVAQEGDGLAEYFLRWHDDLPRW